MSETPVPRNPGQDDHPPGVPAGPGDRPWLGSPDWQLMPQSPDWPEWMNQDAHADDEYPGDTDEYQDPDNAPPPGLDDNQLAALMAEAHEITAEQARAAEGWARLVIIQAWRRSVIRILVLVRVAGILVVGVRVLIHPLRPVRALRHQLPVRGAEPGAVTEARGHAGRIVVLPGVAGNRWVAHVHDPFGEIILVSNTVAKNLR